MPKRSHFFTESIFFVFSRNEFLPAVPSDSDFENALGQQFSSDRFTRAVNTLNQYGPEVGLRKLRESDPELARDIERRLKRPE